MTSASLPKVSVIMPAYKQAAFIEASLDSISAQTYKGPVEILVIDDESPDDTAELARKHPSRPRVIQQKNTGVSGARNRGILAATGEWLAFLDSDDRWAPDKLEAQLEACLALERPCLSMTRYRRVKAGGEPLAKANEHPSLKLEVNPRRLIYQNFIGTSTVLAHRACFDRCGVFPANKALLRGGQDYALWLRIASLFPMVYVPKVLTYYTVHEINRVGIDPLKHHESALHALKDFEAWAPQRFEPLAGASRSAVSAWRSAKLIKDLAWRHSEYPEGTLKRALPTLLKLGR